MNTTSTLPPSASPQETTPSKPKQNPSTQQFSHNGPSGPVSLDSVGNPLVQLTTSPPIINRPGSTGVRQYDDHSEGVKRNRTAANLHSDEKLPSTVASTPPKPTVGPNTSGPRHSRRISTDNAGNKSAFLVPYPPTTLPSSLFSNSGGNLIPPVCPGTISVTSTHPSAPSLMKNPHAAFSKAQSPMNGPIVGNLGSLGGNNHSGLMLQTILVPPLGAAHVNQGSANAGMTTIAAQYPGQYNHGIDKANAQHHAFINSSPSTPVHQPSSSSTAPHFSLHNYNSLLATTGQTNQTGANLGHNNHHHVAGHINPVHSGPNHTHIQPPSIAQVVPHPSYPGYSGQNIFSQFAPAGQLNQVHLHYPHNATLLAGSSQFLSNIGSLNTANVSNLVGNNPNYFLQRPHASNLSLTTAGLGTIGQMGAPGGTSQNGTGQHNGGSDQSSGGFPILIAKSPQIQPGAKSPLLNKVSPPMASVLNGNLTKGAPLHLNSGALEPHQHQVTSNTPQFSLDQHIAHGVVIPGTGVYGGSQPGSAVLKSTTAPSLPLPHPHSSTLTTQSLLQNPTYPNHQNLGQLQQLTRTASSSTFSPSHHGNQQHSSRADSTRPCSPALHQNYMGTNSTTSVMRPPGAHTLHVHFPQTTSRQFPNSSTHLAHPSELSSRPFSTNPSGPNYPNSATHKDLAMRFGSGTGASAHFFKPLLGPNPIPTTMPSTHPTSTASNANSMVGSGQGGGSEGDGQSGLHEPNSSAQVYRPTTAGNHLLLAQQRMGGVQNLSNGPNGTNQQQNQQNLSQNGPNLQLGPTGNLPSMIPKLAGLTTLNLGHNLGNNHGGHGALMQGGHHNHLQGTSASNPHHPANLNSTPRSLHTGDNDGNFHSPGLASVTPHPTLVSPRNLQEGSHSHPHQHPHPHPHPHHQGPQLGQLHRPMLLATPANGGQGVAQNHNAHLQFNFASPPPGQHPHIHMPLQLQGAQGLNVMGTIAYQGNQTLQQQHGLNPNQQQQQQLQPQPQILHFQNGHTVNLSGPINMGPQQFHQQHGVYTGSHPGGIIYMNQPHLQPHATQALLAHPIPAPPLPKKGKKGQKAKGKTVRQAPQPIPQGTATVQTPVNANPAPNASGEVVGADQGQAKQPSKDYNPHNTKICVSCRNSTSVYWRDCWTDIQGHLVSLCNSCGLRYKKCSLACNQCLSVPYKNDSPGLNVLCKICQRGQYFNPNHKQIPYQAILACREVIADFYPEFSHPDLALALVERERERQLEAERRKAEEEAPGAGQEQQQEQFQQRELQKEQSQNGQDQSGQSGQNNDQNDQNETTSTTLSAPSPNPSTSTPSLVMSTGGLAVRIEQGGGIPHSNNSISPTNTVSSSSSSSSSSTSHDDMNNGSNGASQTHSTPGVPSATATTLSTPAQGTLSQHPSQQQAHNTAGVIVNSSNQSHNFENLNEQNQNQQNQQNEQRQQQDQQNQQDQRQNQSPARVHSPSSSRHISSHGDLLPISLRPQDSILYGYEDEDEDEMENDDSELESV